VAVLLEPLAAMIGKAEGEKDGLLVRSDTVFNEIHLLQMQVSSTE